MVLPLPSDHKRFKLKLRVVATRPMMLKVRVYDPSRPNTYYFKRRIPFRPIQFEEKDEAIRDIEIPLPITSKYMVLELFEPGYRGEDHFEIDSFKVEPMSLVKPFAKPERHLFMDFVIDFARKAGFVAPGFYHSKDHEFLIHYMPVITDPLGRELVTPARIHRHMPRVQLSQKLFRKLSIPVRVAILAHEGCHFFKNTRSEKEADLCGIRYYLDYGFPSIEAVYAATKVFGMHPETISRPHVERTKDIMDFIDHYKSKKVRELA